MKDLQHVSININFENDLSQLAIENPMWAVTYMQYVILGRRLFQTALNTQKLA